MSMEGPPEASVFENKFDDLSRRAHEQIMSSLLANAADENKISDIGRQADEMFQVRYEQATNVYFRSLDNVARRRTQESRLGVLTEVIARMARCFSKDGRVEEVTANRLAAVMAQLFEENEDE